jgi:hypothetical protein
MPELGVWKNFFLGLLGKTQKIPSVKGEEDPFD